MPLNAAQRKSTAAVLATTTDEYLMQPLWNFHPYRRPLILSERNRRGFVSDPEPIGDAEYS